MRAPEQSTIQGISLIVGGETVQAEALDLIHGVLLLRVAGARPVDRGERIEASVVMPGSGLVSGMLVGIDGPLVRFEPGVADGVAAPPVRLPEQPAGAPIESVLSGRAAAPPATYAPPPATYAPPPATYAPPPATYPPPPGVAAPPGTRAPYPGGVAPPSRGRASQPPLPAPAGRRRLEERAPARANRAILADALSVATGRNEVPKRVAVLDISVAGAVVRGLDVSPGRKTVLRFELPDDVPLRVLAVAVRPTIAGMVVTFQFDSQRARQRLADAIRTQSLRSQV